MRRSPHISFSALAVMALVLMSAAAASLAHSAQSGDISVGHIWAYPAVTNPSVTSAYGLPAENVIDIYGPFLNSGGSADAITGVSSPSAAEVKLVIWVRGLQIANALPLALPPGTPIALGPQTRFLRLYGASQTYKAGDEFPVTFHFQHAPDVTIKVMVQAK
jgi:copper(I)-binding protein